MSEERLIWFKGNIMPVSQAKINVLSPTSQFGANVFEGIRCYWNDEKKQLFGFRLQEHFNRLLNSVKMLRLELPYSFEEIQKGLFDIIKANEYYEDIAVRQTVFLDGFGSWSSEGPTDMFIAPIAKGRQLDKAVTGISACISSWERVNDNSLSPKIKVGANYINSRMAQMEALRNGYDSTIFLNNQGKVSEGPGSCIFIVRDGCIITPPLTASILESITRDTIIKIAREEFNYEVIERDVDRSELYIADEIFLCGTAVEVIPILSVDKLEVGDGKKGMITKSIEDAYFDIVRGRNENYYNWLTSIY